MMKLFCKNIKNQHCVCIQVGRSHWVGQIKFKNCTLIFLCPQDIGSGKIEIIKRAGTKKEVAMRSIKYWSSEYAIESKKK